MATLIENAAAVKAAAQAIDAAIVAKGGTTEGGLNNAAAAIAALPSGGEPAYPHPWVMSEADPTKLADETHLWYYFPRGGAEAFAYFAAQFRISAERYADSTTRFFTVDWGDGTVEEIAATATLANKTLSHQYDDAGEYHVVISDYERVNLSMSAFSSDYRYTYNTLGGLAIRQAQIGCNETAIGNVNLYGFGLLYIEFQNKLASIGDAVFTSAPCIRAIDLSECEAVGTNAFCGCASLSDITSLSKCKTFGNYNAFKDCRSLVSIGDLPACEILAAYTFQYCTSLISVGNLPVCTSVYMAFDGCTSLRSIGNMPNCTTLGSFTSLVSLESVGELAAIMVPNYIFKNLRNLKSVNLRQVTGIGNEAFSGCSALESVNISSACTSIGNSAFKGCASLESAGDFSACTTIGSDAFYGCSKLRTVGDLPLVTSLGSYNAFGNCASLVSVGRIPLCATIPFMTFAGCASLVSIGDLSSCTSLGGRQFEGCPSLALINFGTQTSAQVTAITGFTELPARQTCVIRCADGDYYRSGSTLLPIPTEG